MIFIFSMCFFFLRFVKLINFIVVVMVILLGIMDWISGGVIVVLVIFNVLVGVYIEW